jgi:hypothetical protein
MINLKKASLFDWFFFITSLKKIWWQGLLSLGLEALNFKLFLIILIKLIAI